jgi:hypothetical protein
MSTIPAKETERNCNEPDRRDHVVSAGKPVTAKNACCVALGAAR